MILLARESSWPDWIDGSVLLVFFLLVVVLPTLGYYFMVVDFRAWLRRLKGALVRVIYYFPDLPIWARYETPGYLRWMGLTVPCSEADVHQAYLRLAEQYHPDRGGDLRSFMLLQDQFEKSLNYVRNHQPEYRAATD